MTKVPRTPSDYVPAPPIAAAVQAHLTEGKLACRDAFVVASQERITPGEVGKSADALGVRLASCQLGLFGYPGKQGWHAGGVTDLPVPEGLEAAISEAVDDDRRLTCARAWVLADLYGITRLQFGWIAEMLEVKIVTCQLGAF